MALKAGINGFGRIGRNVFRAAHARGEDIDWVGVNDITDTATLAHLLRFDSILGPFSGEVEHTENSLIVDGAELRVFAERDPADLPWADVGADVVIESPASSPSATTPPSTSRPARRRSSSPRRRPSRT
jgi:glyceraldehyde 3-phosphate dehydrogenase